MLQSMGSQRVRHDLVAKQQIHKINLKKILHCTVSSAYLSETEITDSPLTLLYINIMTYIFYFLKGKEKVKCTINLGKI